MNTDSKRRAVGFKVAVPLPVKSSSLMLMETKIGSKLMVTILMVSTNLLTVVKETGLSSTMSVGESNLDTIPLEPKLVTSLLVEQVSNNAAL
jgi:hypothetical protein